jgi:hypothetical protein
MPFLPFVLLLAWQAVSKSASFALGWATAIYFGQVPGKPGRMLAVISLASAAWVIVIVGFALPLLGGAILEALGVIGRNFQVVPLHVIGLWAAIVLAPPVIAGITVLADFHDERSIRSWLRMIPISYPAVASLGAGVIQMVVFTPILLVRRWMKKQSLLQTALSMREETDDDDLTETVKEALHTIGVDDVSVEKAQGILAWPMLTVGFAAEHLVGAVVRGEPMRLRADGLQLFAYATNVAVLGPSEQAHRARAALERELPFDHARLTWSDDAQDLEDAIIAAREEAGDDLRDLHERLDRVQERIDTESLNAEEWNILYRLRLQAEHELFEREVRGGGTNGNGRGEGGEGGAVSAVSARTSGRRTRRP